MGSQDKHYVISGAGGSQVQGTLAGHCLEWSAIKQDLMALQEVTIDDNGRKLAVRTECFGICGKIFQVFGVALPPSIREVS